MASRIRPRIPGGCIAHEETKDASAPRAAGPELEKSMTVGRCINGDRRNGKIWDRRKTTGGYERRKDHAMRERFQVLHNELIRVGESLELKAGLRAMYRELKK